MPALHEPCTAFLRTSSHRLCLLLAGTRQRVGPEFTLPVELAVAVPLAARAGVRTRALFAGDADTTTLQEVVLATTRPLETPAAAAAQDAGPAGA